MPTDPEIMRIVGLFRTMTDRARYFQLCDLLDGHADEPSVLNWRASLCTALREAEVYPLKAYER